MHEGWAILIDCAWMCAPVRLDGVYQVCARARVCVAIPWDSTQLCVSLIHKHVHTAQQPNTAQRASVHTRQHAPQSQHHSHQHHPHTHPFPADTMQIKLMHLKEWQGLDERTVYSQLLAEIEGGPASVLSSIEQPVEALVNTLHETAPYDCLAALDFKASQGGPGGPELKAAAQGTGAEAGAASAQSGGGS